MLTGRPPYARPVMSSPSILMQPASGLSKPEISRSRVVLPEPDAPTRQKKSPRAISSDTPATAGTDPKLLVTPSILMAGGALTDNQTNKTQQRGWSTAGCAPFHRQAAPAPAG